MKVGSRSKGHIDDLRENTAIAQWLVDQMTIRSISRLRAKAVEQALSVAADIALSVASAGAYEGIKTLVKMQLGTRRSRKTYSDRELIEHAQRALTIRYPFTFHELEFDAIEATPQGEATVKFHRGTSSVEVTIKMFDDVAVVQRPRLRTGHGRDRAT